MNLKERYQALLQKYNIQCDEEFNISSELKLILRNFTSKCKNPAIWCYGVHTKMLMTDYISEMKSVKFIIDKKLINSENSGFKIISDDDIISNQIDGIIISSYKYKNEIVDVIKEKYSSIKYLDIYEELQNRGISIDKEYYMINHPYVNYSEINKLNRMIMHCTNTDEKIILYKNLIEIYIKMKDFKTAVTCLEEFIKVCDTAEFQEMLTDLKEIYQAEIDAAKLINKNNILMLCVDGLKYRDIAENSMPETKKYIDNNMMSFSNAYSASISTHESLLPAYSENNDLRTKYYKKSSISEDECRFIKQAIAQKRKICFYTDMDAFIDSKKIQYNSKAHSASEKLWSFILDAENTENGLFYIHILYESHFSYPNPYTKEPIIAEGTSIFFDYLSKNGGKIRTDYIKQNKDALRYLDDIVSPFLKRLDCNIVFYADHGNVIWNQDTLFEDIEYTKFTFHDDLIHIPFAVKSYECKAENCESLFSIMSFNDVIVNLMNHSKFNVIDREYIKMARSELYNPDFKYSYKKRGFERGLLHFEGFIFKNGYKLIVYSDGVYELYSVSAEEKVNDSILAQQLIAQVKNDITVCDVNLLNYKDI